VGHGTKTDTLFDEAVNERMELIWGQFVNKMIKLRRLLAVCLVFLISSAFAQEQNNRNLNLYILMGQSNMAGRGLIDDEFKNERHNRVWMFNSANEWVEARHPLHFDKPKVAGVGPGLAFGIKMAEASPDAKIGLIPCAVGGTSIERWQPGAYDPVTKTHPYDDAAARIKLAMAYGVIKGVIWHQGEANSKPKNSKAYLARLAELISRVRELTGNPDLPFIAGELGRFRPAFVNFNKQLDSIPLIIPHTGLVSSKGLVHKGDSTHFDGQSASKLGGRYAEKMIKVQRRSKSIR